MMLPKNAGSETIQESTEIAVSENGKKLNAVVDANVIKVTADAPKATDILKEVITETPPTLQKKALAELSLNGKIDQTLGEFQKGFDSILSQLTKTDGDGLLKILGMIGGRGFLINFCSKFKLDYATRFASVEQLYLKTHEFNGDQGLALQAIYEIKPTKDIDLYYTDKDWANNNFHLLDPNLVSDAMKITNKDITDVCTKDNPPMLNLSVIAQLSDDQKLNIVSQMLKNPKMKSDIANLNRKETAEEIYGKAESNKRQEKLPMTPEANAVVVGAFLMKGSTDLKYVLSYNKMPYEEQTKTYIENKTKSNSETTIDKDKKIIIDGWTKIFDEPKWSVYPLPEATIKGLVDPQKTVYETYTKTVYDRISTLLNPNNKDKDTILEDPLVKDKLSPFLKQHFSVYLANLALDTNPLYKNPKNKVAIDKLTTSFDSIRQDKNLSISFGIDGVLSIKGKKTAEKSIEIKSNEFIWLPVKVAEPTKTTEAANTPEAVKTI